MCISLMRHMTLISDLIPSLLAEVFWVCFKVRSTNYSVKCVIMRLCLLRNVHLPSCCCFSSGSFQRYNMHPFLKWVLLLRKVDPFFMNVIPLILLWHFSQFTSISKSCFYYGLITTTMESSRCVRKTVGKVVRAMIDSAQRPDRHWWCNGLMGEISIADWNDRSSCDPLVLQCMIDVHLDTFIVIDSVTWCISIYFIPRIMLS